MTALIVSGLAIAFLYCFKNKILRHVEQTKEDDSDLQKQTKL